MGRMEISKQSSDSDQGLRMRAGAMALGIGILIFAGKWLAYFLTGSTAVYSDAMESVVNVVAGGMLIYSLRVAARPPDHDHPYGHGKVEFFSAGVEGTMISFAAFLIFMEAGRGFLEGREVKAIDQGLWILMIAAVLNGALGMFLVRTGRKTNSLALIADGKHLLTDVYTSLGVVGGLIGIWITGWKLIDPIVAALMGLLILREGSNLIREAVRGLMDEADDDLLEEVVRVLGAERKVWHIDFHSLRVWRSGHFYHVDMHVEIPRYYDIERQHEINEELEVMILDGMKVPGEAIFHFDPCRPRLCTMCAIEDCAIREAQFEAPSPVTLMTATREDEALDTGIPLSEATRS